MSKTLVALLFALPFAAPVAATQYLRVVNAHATPIVAVAVAPLGSEAWSTLSLADAPLHRGEQLGVTLSGTHRCRYDLRVIHADGRAVTRRAFNLCRDARYAPALAG